MTHESAELKFVTTEEYPEQDVKRVQQKSLELLEKIIAIFNENNIDYMIAHGTLLGYVRHHGKYIPWDDDCDLFVFDWCYARAVELLRRNLPDDMVVHNRRTDPIYWPTWTKIRDMHSDTYESLWTIDRKLKYHGICIDLLRATDMTAGEYRLAKETERYNQWNEKCRKAAGAGYVSKKTRLKQLFLKACFKMKRIGLRFLAAFNRKRLIIANYGTVIEGSFPYKAVFPLKDGIFEGVHVKVPCNPDGVLKGLYGNYMEIPPLEKRLPHFSRVEFLD